MPSRKSPLVTGEIYHVYNRTIDRKDIFTSKKECLRAVETIRYYRFLGTQLRLSELLQLESTKRLKIQKNLSESEKLIYIYSNCLMSNHYHFLLKQVADNGICKFMGNFQNSYTRYFNVKNKRVGPIFLTQFKAVRIETLEQFLHVSRYIHLNPYSGFLVKDLSKLEEYHYSSLPHYLKKVKLDYIEDDLILSLMSAKSYKDFVFDQADYQRELKTIEHLLLEQASRGV